jgi:hypothetical protein
MEKVDGTTLGELLERTTRAMAKWPEERYPDAASFAKSLRAALKAELDSAKRQGQFEVKQPWPERAVVAAVKGDVQVERPTEPAAHEQALPEAKNERKASETALEAEAKRRAELAARLAEGKRKADEAARLAEEKRRALREHLKAEEAARAASAQEQTRRAAEERWPASEAARPAEQQRRAKDAARQATALAPETRRLGQVDWTTKHRIYLLVGGSILACEILILLYVVFVLGTIAFAHDYDFLPYHESGIDIFRILPKPVVLALNHTLYYISSGDWVGILNHCNHNYITNKTYSQRM